MKGVPFMRDARPCVGSEKGSRTLVLARVGKSVPNISPNIKFMTEGTTQ
jgi:hypothetical protein